MMKITFILYKPAVAGNIGACARAMKNMGFTDLRLISPAKHLSDEALMMAHASHDILQNSKVFASLDEAIADIDFLVSTTAKDKSGKVDYISSRQLKSFLENKEGIVSHAGILFGSEESGLPNEILLKSNIGVHIPMVLAYPSLNLAQALMIIAYELSEKGEEGEDTEGEEQGESSWKELQQRAEYLLIESGIPAASPLYHRILERMSFMKASDARLAHSITAKLLDIVKK